MTEQIRDALRHLEKDMVDILDVMQDKSTVEVILNPYRLFDGNYEGHILVDKQNHGLNNLYRYRVDNIESPELNFNDIVIVKESKNNILFWMKPSADKQQLAKQLAWFVQYKFEDNIISHHENIDLVSLADQIENDSLFFNSYSYEIIHSSEDNTFKYYEEIITQINKNLPVSALFTLRVLHLNSEVEKNYLPKYPAMINHAELVKMTSTKAETIMSVLASITGKFIHNKSPKLECQIPKYGHRFTGIIPPAAPFPAFCIRKHSSHIYTLDDFVKQGIMEKTSQDTIISWIERKFNILIAGGTGSGKTTLANAILHEIAKRYPETRILIIEDVPELQFNTTRSIAFTIGEFFNMYDALRTTLRFKPNRIVMGEIRGAEAYTLLKAWNTGHPGGVATIHANGVNEALYRFESCIRDHPEVKINRQEIGFTVNGIISIQNITLRETINGQYENIVKRKVTALRQILQYDPDKDIYQDIIYDKITEFLD